VIARPRERLLAERLISVAELLRPANPINRYSISARQSLKSNPDDRHLYIQNVSPAKTTTQIGYPPPQATSF
jgi:hypothetical protein